MTAAVPWHRQNLVAFDVETTGVDVFTDRIVSCSVVRVVTLPRPQRPEARSWLIDPGVDIPESAAAIHGWTTERIQAHPAAMDPAQALFEIGGAIAYPLLHGQPLVAFNAAYDLTIFEVECRRHGVPTLAERLAPRPIHPVVDPYVIDKAMSRRRGKRTLQAQCEYHGVTLADAHSSAGDALAAARLVAVLARKHKALADWSPAELHRWQVTWRSEQQASLREYLRTKGQDVSGVDEAWPVRPLRERAGVPA